MTLGNEALKGALIEDINKFFLKNHLIEFFVKGATVLGSKLLDTYALAHCILRTTSLTDLSNIHISIDADLHFLLAQLVTIDCKSATRLNSNASNGCRVAEDITIHQQELTVSHHFTCHPKRINIIIVLVVGVVEIGEPKISLGTYGF